MDEDIKKTWVQEIRAMNDGDIEKMMGKVSPFSAITDRRFDFAVLELQRRVQVKNVKVVRELKVGLCALSEQLKDYRDDTKRESMSMLILTVLLGVVAVFQLLLAYGQFKLGETGTESSQEQIQLQNAIWQYEIMRNDRIEQRDVEWRRQDQELQASEKTKELLEEAETRVEELIEKGGEKI